jgi:hypothetical protein
MSVARQGVRSLGLACALVLAPALTHAQTDTGGAAGTKPLESWRFGIDVDGTWYENPRFLNVGQTAGQDASWSVYGRARLKRDHRLKTGTFAFSIFGGGIYYPQITGYNQPTYGGDFALEWQPGRRTTVKLGEIYERTSTRFLSAVDSAGLPLPTSAANYSTSTLGIEQKLSKYWFFALDGSFQYRRYDDPTLIGSEQVYANARLGHQVGPRGQIYLAYGLSSAWIGSDTLRSHQVLIGGMRKAAAPGAGFELAGGVGYVESTQQFYPSGRAGLTLNGHKVAFRVLYYRDFGQAYGYGRETIGDIGSATFSWNPVRRFGLAADYYYGYRRDPADLSYKIHSSIATAGFNWTVGGGLELGARYGWEHNDTTGVPLLEGSRVSFTLSYGVDWR